MRLPPKHLLTVALGAGLALLATCAAGGNRPAAPDVAVPRVRTGLDVLAAEGFAPLRGKRVGLITNQTGRTADGRRGIDLLAAAPGVKLVKLFSPEHGLAGKLDSDVSNSVDAATGLPVESLYGAARRPTPAMLAGLDALVFDIQGAGVRYYTYVTTMGYTLEAAAREGIEFVVLDRPDPLNGVAVDGPMLDGDRLNFEGYFPLPLRPGMTLGELARLFNAENHIGAKLTVVPMGGWRRGMWFDETGLTWVNPSPNLRSLTGNALYPAVELLREGGVSVGRGTETPFEVLGAPWIDGEELARYLNQRRIPGVRFTAVEFTPTEDVAAGKLCHGVGLTLTDRDALDAGRLGVELLSAVARLYPQEFKLEKTIRLLGNEKTLERLRSGDDPVEIVAGWNEDLDRFKEMRAKYLLYE